MAETEPCVTRNIKWNNLSNLSITFVTDDIMAERKYRFMGKEHGSLFLAFGDNREVWHANIPTEKNSMQMKQHVNETLVLQRNWYLCGNIVKTHAIKFSFRSGYLMRKTHLLWNYSCIKGIKWGKVIRDIVLAVVNHDPHKSLCKRLQKYPAFWKHENN